MAKVARGTKLEAFISSVWTAVPGVTNLNSNNARPPIADGDLTSGDAETYLPGIIDGDISGDINFDRTNPAHARMDNDLMDGTARPYRITWSDGSIETVTCLVATLNKSAERAGLQRGNFTLQRSGHTAQT